MDLRPTYYYYTDNYLINYSFKIQPRHLRIEIPGKHFDSKYEIIYYFAVVQKNKNHKKVKIYFFVELT